MQTALAAGALGVLAFELTKPRIPDEVIVHQPRFIRRGVFAPQINLVHGDHVPPQATLHEAIAFQESALTRRGNVAHATLRHPDMRPRFFEPKVDRQPYPLLPDTFPTGLRTVAAQAIADQFHMQGKKPRPVPRPPTGNMFQSQVTRAGFNF